MLLGLMQEVKEKERYCKFESFCFGTAQIVWN